MFQTQFRAFAFMEHPECIFAAGGWARTNATNRVQGIALCGRKQEDFLLFVRPAAFGGIYGTGGIENGKTHGKELFCSLRHKCRDY